MVCTANDLLGWSDFPKGLRVLLLDEDVNSSAEIKSKLEKMDYIVSLFCNEDDALVAISNRSNNFHVAIVEVNTENSYGRFEFLEAAKDLPTIMTSNTQCLSTMMKCIALGAVEFLSKPLSDEKLKNIWQHVVHKAFNAGGKDLPESLKPIDEFVLSIVSTQIENKERKSNLLVKIEENDHENSTMSDRYPAPLTPQLKQGVRLVDDGDCQDQTNLSTERENVDQDGESSKFVESTSCNIVDEVNIKVSQSQHSGENIVNDENQGHDICNSESNLSSQPKIKDGCERSVVHNSCVKKVNRKKMKVNTVCTCQVQHAIDIPIPPSKGKGLVDWNPELHKKFLQAVEQLGVDQAIPSRILDVMKVEGLTRHNIASHLQKYRLQHRHILPKENDRRWPPRRDLYQRSYYPRRPVMAYPPYHNATSPNVQLYPMWGPHGNYPSGVQMWRPAYYAPWQPNESWHWQPYPGMHADAWGCPVMPPPHDPHQPPPQNVDVIYNTNAVHGSSGVPQDSFDLYPAEDEIDRVVKEAISKPWLPLPIGLKPPSTDSVLTELSKNGIPTIPPCHITNPIRHL